MRILLNKFVNALSDDAVAVRTDAVYTTLGEDEATEKLIKAEFRFAGKTIYMR